MGTVKKIFSDAGDGVFPLAAGEGGGSISVNAAKPVATIAHLADYLVSGFWAYNNALPHKWASNTITYNITGLNADEQFLARSALAAWRDVANLTFIETTGTANITFTHNGSMQAVTNASWYGSGAMASATVNISTNWVTSDGGANDGKTGIDSYAYQTYIHEIGHALGLGHQGPYNGSAVYSTNALYANDTWQYSIMSYFSQPNYSGSSYRYVVTPQMADIYAVGVMYGAATTTRTGDTIYGFNSNAGAVFRFGNYTSAPALTIYDNGGSDTLDCSLYFNSQRIDLRSGSFSSIGGLTNNIGIDLQTVIEKAIGGGGSDTLIANEFGCTLIGGAGADNLLGGVGSDTAGYNLATAGLIARLDNPIRNTGEAAGDSYSAIENLQGSQFGDTLCGDARANILSGLAGNDALWGYGGGDTLDGGDGDDYLVGAAGPDTFIGGRGSDTASYYFAGKGMVARLDNQSRNTGEAEGDTYSDIENLYGSQFADTLCGNSGVNHLTGWAGNDSLWGYGGGDKLDGGDGNDYLVGASDADTFIGGNGNDTVSYYFAASGLIARLDSPARNTGEAAGDIYSSVENLYGSQFADTLCGDASANIMTGWAGNDSLWGYGGGDTLDGGDGNDYLVGAAGSDTFIGGNGSDTVSYHFSASGVLVSLSDSTENSGEAAGDTYSAVENVLGSSYSDTLIGNLGANLLQGGNGDDKLIGGVGNDTLSGGTGSDTFVFRPGEISGDTIIDFATSGAGDEDKLEFHGFGAGATFAMVDATHAKVSYNGGTSEELLIFNRAVVMDPGDILFV